MPALGDKRIYNNEPQRFDGAAWMPDSTTAVGGSDQYRGWQGNGHEYFADDEIIEADPNTGNLHIWISDADHLSVGEDFDGTDFTMGARVGTSYPIGSRNQYANGTGDAGIWSGGELSEGQRLKNISDKVPSAFDSNIAVGTYGSNGAIGMVGWAVDPIDNRPYVTTVAEVTVATNPSQTPLQWEPMVPIGATIDPVVGQVTGTQTNITDNQWHNITGLEHPLPGSGYGTLTVRFALSGANYVHSWTVHVDSGTTFYITSEANSKATIDQLKNEQVNVYYPDATLAVSLDDPGLPNNVRVWASGDNVVGPYAIQWKFDYFK